MRRIRMIRSLACFSIFAFALVIAVSGCGGGGSSPDASVIDATASQEAAGPPQPFCTGKSALASVTDLSGTWVMRLVGAQVTNAQFVGQISSQNVFYMLANVTQNGSAVALDGRYCDRAENNAPNALVPVIIPAAWAHTETPVHRAGLFTVGADGFAVLTLLPYTENVGMLASCTGTLPTSATDSCVYDEDGDGQPGITIALSGLSTSGRLFSVQRQTTSASAIAVAANRIEGSLTFDSQQSVVASDPVGLTAQYQNSQTFTDPVACNSNLTMVKIADAPSMAGVVDGGDWDGGILDGGAAVDGGAVSCDWVRANESVLFP